MIARVLGGAASAASVMAIIALAALAGVTIVDVIGRYVFNRPVFGSIEMSEFLLVVLGFGGLALAELRNGHITVDFLVTALPGRLQSLLEAAAALLGIVFWGFVAWRAIVHAGRIADVGEVSANWGIPTYPFYLASAFGSALFAAVLVARALRALHRATGTWTPPPSA